MVGVTHPRCVASEQQRGDVSRHHLPLAVLQGECEEGPVNLTLASSSPRRRDILRQLGFVFDVLCIDVCEEPLADEPPRAYLKRVVYDKWRAAREARAAGTVLVADTIVVADSLLLGKPRDSSEGAAMLRALSGLTHEVHTGFAVGAEKEPAHFEIVTTRVTFRTIGYPELEAYVASGEGMGKAGGYAIQGRAAAFAARLEGSYTAVVGLPACEVTLALGKLGIVPLVE